MTDSSVSRQIRGDTNKLLLDYGKRAAQSGNERLWVETLAKYAGVEIDSAKHWLAGSRPPMGETLLRVRCYLSLLFYEVKELQGLPQVARDLAYIIALDLVSIDEATSRVGYTKRDALLGIILRGRSPMPDKLFKIDQIVGEYREELPVAYYRAHNDVSERLNVSVTSDVHKMDTLDTSPVSEVPHETDGDISHEDEAIAYLISALDVLISGVSDIDHLTQYVRLHVSTKARTTVGNLMVNAL